MLTKRALRTIGLTLALGMMSTPVFAGGKVMYKEASVANGGTIKGVVALKGDVPPPIMKDLNKEKNSEFCSNHPTTKDGIRTIRKVEVNDGKLRNAVVLIENIESGKAWSKEPTHFEFKNCDIFPKVTVVRKPAKGVKKGLVTITNEDPDILHNPHGYMVKGAKRQTLFNKPLPSKGANTDVTKTLKRFKKNKKGNFFVQCDQHNFMEADARMVWNPYFTVTGDDGSFALDQVPAGKYKVTAWHPYVGQVTQEISVTGGKEADAQFELAVK